MKMIFFSTLFSLFCFNANSQCIKDVYAYTDGEPCACSFDSNIVTLHPIPFEVTYIVELDSKQYISTLEVDRNIPNLKVSTYREGNVVYFPNLNDQTFCIEAETRYLFVTYTGDCKKVHLYIK